MTCIVGLVEDDVIYMGGDSAGVAGWDLRIRVDKKVFVKNDMVFGFTSSFRMGQIIQYNFNIPEHSQGKETMEYLCGDFIDALTKCFKEKGFAKIESEEVQGGIFLLGYNGGLYKIEEDFQVGIIQEKYNACGCGESYAIGALKALEHIEMKPVQRVETALSIAADYSAGVRGPFNIIEFDWKEVWINKGFK